MTGAEITRLALMGVVFLIWAVSMFSTLFLLRARAEKRTGRVFSGPIVFLKEIGHWLRAPEDKLRRRNLGVLTLALVVMIATGAFLGGR
ncbi:MAG: hypothetical protein ACE368_19070 [Paracoccaceae bacterium]